MMYVTDQLAWVISVFFFVIENSKIVDTPISTPALSISLTCTHVME